ncbi:uncharacterized protein PFL1_06097 [Pseudozyma flocculosa PF-1]|uniref:Related to metalloprotease MEP1 n=2 Tax=Pseudozyma flocculosa TaxID=84751 RepID=A0A5C3F4R9_9BASI|nr:uncharacterized protein PFL1_06097 [Pseudozyma flocculosa PF-1]EPQ26449.1 hypothetical protein PFL1_06097 [Pseudozyma flocculosa PF-1]SPO38956.1 related to metalloprotease MEP1 [Pseudozyma flocculosa]
MQFNIAFVLSALVAVPAALAGTIPKRGCGTHEKHEEHEKKVQERIANIRVAAAAKQIPVSWHTITDGTSGKLTASQVQASIDVLNKDYASTGFSFYLSASETVTNKSWFTGVDQGTTAEAQMKNSLRDGNALTLNVYTVSFGSSGLLGYATFPWSYSGAPKNDGVVIAYQTYPGSSYAPFNQGRTLTHEVGHWLGLYHVFQGGCTGSGDSVSDTPAQSTATSGCPSSQDSCPNVAGVDSIHNFLDYSDDACMYQFTAGQTSRMAQIVSAYRG